MIETKRIKQGDQADTEHGKGEVYRLYYSRASMKPCKAHIKFNSGEIKLVFLSECTPL